jgi:hypothetical protein
MQNERNFMTDKTNRDEVLQRKRPRGKQQSTHNWQIEDAARSLFKAQCYDAGADSETRCGLCGERMRLCYVLKVLAFTDTLAPEVGKLTIGECCFRSIKAVNERLYRQLLAAAINLRTFMEAVERDKRVFAGSMPQDVPSLPSPLGADEEATWVILEQSIAEGGDHV